MGFRERPEYQDWRDSVFRLFGQKCIRCGHVGNIHAHHVMPVNEYPELVFEPTNGVPLCGNCHTEIKGDEWRMLRDLRRLQQGILGGEASAVASNKPNELGLRERAFAEPSNVEAVEAWFEVANAQAVIDFYDQHHEDATKTGSLCMTVVTRLAAAGRWQDVIAVADKAMEIVEREETPEERVGSIGHFKQHALYELGRLPEAVDFLRELIGRFPKVATLHYQLSWALYITFVREQPPAEAIEMLEESVRHALTAIELSPDEYSCVSWAPRVLRTKGDYGSALRYGKRALALASTDADKVDALQDIAMTYSANNLYSDARSCLREAMQIDDCNVDVIADMAHCFFMEDNNRESLRMAKHGLMLDPQNELCRDICKRLG